MFTQISKKIDQLIHPILVFVNVWGADEADSRYSLIEFQGIAREWDKGKPAGSTQTSRINHVSKQQLFCAHVYRCRLCFALASLWFTLHHRANPQGVLPFILLFPTFLCNYTKFITSSCKPPYQSAPVAKRIINSHSITSAAVNYNSKTQWLIVHKKEIWYTIHSADARWITVSFM